MTERIDKAAEAARGQDELKRCPSDGEKAKRSSRETAWLNGRGYDKEYCTECGVCGFATRYYDTPEEADAAWNRRSGEDGWEAEQAYAKLYGKLQEQHHALLDEVCELSNRINRIATALQYRDKHILYLRVEADEAKAEITTLLDAVKGELDDYQKQFGEIASMPGTAIVRVTRGNLNSIIAALTRIIKHSTSTDTGRGTEEEV